MEGAESQERRAKELKDKIDGLITRLSQRLYYLNDEVLPGLQVAKNSAKMLMEAHWQDEKTKTEDEIKSLRAEVKDLEKELEKLEKGMGKTFKSALRSSFDKAKKEETRGDQAVDNSETPTTGEASSDSGGASEQTPEKKKGKFKKVWSWVKERVKTILLDGGLVIGEVRQAEMMRKGTKYAAANAEAMSTLIKTEWNVDNPDAVQDIVNEALKVERKTGIRMDNDNLGGMIDKVSGDRKEANDDEKDYIIKNAIEDLKSNLAKARGQATSETVLTSENLAKVQAEMRNELNKLSDAALVRDVKGFAKVMRDNLDKYWWLRYLYGATELGVLGWMGYQWLNKDTMTIANVAKPKLSIPEQLAPKDVPDETRLMLDHYWGVAKRLWAEHGVSNPTDSQIMSVDKVLALDNNVAVPEWGIKGGLLHTKLPVHWVLVKGGVAIIRATLGS